MTTTYYAVTNANGLISQELEAETLGDAIRELETAIEDDSAREWIDIAQTDLEDAREVDGTAMTAPHALSLCSAHGARFEWGDNTDDSWDIWSLTA